MHGYHDSWTTFPPQAIRRPDGTPLLSWRVALLPFIEENALYQQFHLDEPWDSPRNRALLDRMPKIYADPKKPEKNLTVYQVFVGPGAMFENQPQFKLGINSITDGTSNTLMVVEAPQPVPWTKPEDITFIPNQAPTRMSARWRGKFLGLFGDGSVRQLEADMPTFTLQAYITRAGGEVVPDEWDEPRRRFP